MKHPSHWQDGIDRLQQRLAAWHQKRDAASAEESLANAARLLAELAESQVELAQEYEALHQAHGEMLQVNEHLRGKIASAPHVEEALRTQALVLENMAEGVTVTDRRGYILYTNPAFDAMFGYEPGELLGRHSNILNQYPPEENLSVIREILGQVDTTGAWFGEFFNRRKDGSTFYTSARISALETNDKSLYISVQEDITERQRAEEALRVSENRFRAFMDNSPTIAFAKDEAGRYVYLSKTLEQRFGVSMDGWGGKTDFELWPREIAEAFRRNDLAVLAGNQAVEVIEEAITPEGRRCFCWTFKFPFEDAAGERFVGGIGLDITARRQAEEEIARLHCELQNRVQELETLLEVAPIGIAMADDPLCHNIISNRAGSEIMAIPQGAKISFGPPPDDKLHFQVLKDGRQLSLEELPMQRACLGNESVRNFECEFVWETGQRRTVLCSAEPLHHPDGRVRGVVAAILDITKRQRGEEALRRAYDKLEERVAERTAALRLANEQLLREMAERQAAEDSLRESEARFKAFMDHLPGLAAMRDVRGYYVFANQTWEQLFGANWQGKTLEEFWPPKEAKRFQHMDQQVLLAGKPVESLDTLEFADGPRTILSSSFPIRDKDGLPYLVGTIGIDVTARRQAEEALAAERQRLFSLLENLPAFVYLQAPDYTVRFANRQFRERFGEPEGKPCYTVIQGLDYPCPECPTFQIFDTGEPVDWEWQAPNGQFYQIYDYPFEDVDGSPLVLEMGIDITERKMAEEALAKNEAMLRLILDNLPVGVYVADHNGRIILSNPAGQTIWGGARYVGIEHYGEYRGWWADSGRRIAPEEWALARAVQKGEKSLGEIINIEGFDGARKVIRNSGVPLRGPHQEILGGIVVIEDITEVRRAEKVMREQARQLQAFFAHSLTPFVLLDRNFNFLQVNEAYARACQRQVWEFLGRNHFELYPHEENQAIFTEVVRTKTPYQAVAKAFEFPDHREWGLTYWDWSLTPILDEAGEIDFLVFSLKDVTEQVHAEEERRRLVDILENTPDFVGIADGYGRLQYLNRAGRALVGVGEDEDVRRLKVLQLHPEGVGELIIKEGAPAAVRQGVWQAETALLHRDGREISVSQVILAHKDHTGRVQFFSTIARDISPLKKAQESILRQTAILNGINRIFWEALTCETEEELGRTCLAVAEELTSSRFGFIDTLNEQGYFDALAFSDPGWEYCRIAGVTDLSHLKNIRPVGLLGKPVLESKTLLTNNPAAHPEAAGLPAGHPPLTAYLGAPLFFGRQPIGLIGLGNKAGGYTDADREALEILAPTMVEALMHHRARKDVKISERKMRHLADQLLTAQENERKRLAAELHDELGHALLTLKLAFSSILREMLPGQDQIKQQIESQLAYINEVIGEVRRLYHDLSPGDVEDLGLTRALQGLIEDFGGYQRNTAWFVDLPDLDGFFPCRCKLLFTESCRKP
jgi:PAS domain S-box-containing protein